MKLSRLQLKNYRNYTNLDIQLSPGLNIFVGNNAQGKSNILEAIFVLALTKSYMNVKDQNLIQDGKDFFSIRANYFYSEVENQVEIIFGNHIKKLKINSNEIKKYNDYISTIKVLIFSPYNVNFIKDGPSVRRKNINMVISQLSNYYVHLLQNYNAILKKRNQFLKSIDYLNEYNRFYLEALNEKFCMLAVDIVLERKRFIDKVNEFLSNIYREITDFDHLILDYVTNVSIVVDKKEMISQLKDRLKMNFNKEKSCGVTLIGPHRDDFVFLLENKDLSIYGSQGQIRAAILAEKLSEVFIFKEKDDDYPILLLDDIFSELDIEKRNRLVKYILNDVQTIITTTDINNIESTLVENACIFNVCNGNIVDERKRECKDE